MYFGVFNFEGTPEVVTKAAGIAPTRQWVKGDSYGDKGGIRTHSRWELASPAAPDASFETQLDALVDLLEKHAESIRAVAASFDSGVNVAAYFRESFNPGFHASAPMLKRLADLGLSLDFDLYFLNESTR
ncbi:MAG: DUF4279 domain-containing protein [bacterium]